MIRLNLIIYVLSFYYSCWDKGYATIGLDYSLAYCDQNCSSTMECGGSNYTLVNAYETISKKIYIALKILN